MRSDGSGSNEDIRGHSWRFGTICILYIGQSLAEALQQMALVADSHPLALELLDRGKSILQTLLEARPNNHNLNGMSHVNEQNTQMLIEKERNN